jgi:hypothetical protein
MEIYSGVHGAKKKKTNSTKTIDTKVAPLPETEDPRG